MAHGQNQAILPTANTLPAGQEIFRFDEGFASQIQQGTNFLFGPSNRWFALGQVTNVVVKPFTVHVFKLMNAPWCRVMRGKHLRH